MTTIEKKSLRVGKYVDSNHVNTLVSNYKRERWAHNTEQIGKEDTLSIWYSIEELEEFISKAKKTGANGIRMWFGVYPDQFDAKPEAVRQQTIVLVANKHQVTETGFIEKNVYVNTEKGAQILAYNYGSQCPTYCGGRSPIGDDGDDWGGIGVTIVDRGEKGLAVL